MCVLETVQSVEALVTAKDLPCWLVDGGVCALGGLLCRLKGVEDAESRRVNREDMSSASRRGDVETTE